MIIEQELQKYNLPDAAIEELSKRYMPLTIADVADKQGYKDVAEALAVVRGKRIAVEDKRKELKEESLRFGRTIDAEAKRITALLEPIERHLNGVKGWFETEKEAIKQAVIKKQQEELQLRVDALIAYKKYIPIATLQIMKDSDYQTLLVTAKSEFDAAELIRITAEQEAEQIAAAEKLRQSVIVAEQAAIVASEKARLDAIFAEQEAERQRLSEIAKQQAEKEAALIAEQSRIKAAEQEAIRKVAEEKRIEEAKRDAVESERKRMQSEAEEKAAEQERQKALLPEKEKLELFATAIFELASHVPELKELWSTGTAARLRLLSTCAWLRTEIRDKV